MNTGQLFVLSAPSGAGKSTVLQSVLKSIKALAFSISHTTRLPRKGEENGVEYHFVDRKVFKKMIADGDFLEYAEVHGNYYGTSWKEIENQISSGVDVILDIDVQGARIVRGRKNFDTIFLFLAPPNLSELEKRLQGRGLDSQETIALRLSNAKSEMNAVDEYDYLIVNDKIEDAVRMMEAVILAERAKNRKGIDGNPLRLSE